MDSNNEEQVVFFYKDLISTQRSGGIIDQRLSRGAVSSSQEITSFNYRITKPTAVMKPETPLE
jgi:hypothetical protein